MHNPYQFLNEYYDKIYVLSLPRLKDRIAHINKELAGLNFEFFWGVDKNESSITDFIDQNIYDPNLFKTFYKKPKEMHLGMLCCTLSHLNIYKDIIKNGYKKVLIFEDDCLLIKENTHLYSRIFQELPADWELFYLGYEKNENYGFKQKIKRFVYRLLKTHATLKITRSMFKYYYPRKISEHIDKAGYHDCAHAYALTLDGAKKIVKQQTPIYFSSDNVLSYMCTNQTINGYISKPKLFSQLTVFENRFKSMTSEKEGLELLEG
jgi:glycosyl transferase, family 25